MGNVNQSEISSNISERILISLQTKSWIPLIMLMLIMNIFPLMDTLNITSINIIYHAQLVKYILQNSQNATLHPM